jgi:hypothetical protein
MPGQVYARLRRRISNSILGVDIRRLECLTFSCFDLGQSHWPAGGGGHDQETTLVSGVASPVVWMRKTCNGSLIYVKTRN